MQTIARDEVIELNVIPFLEDVLKELKEQKSRGDLVLCIKLLSLCVAELSDMLLSKRRKK